VRKIGVFNHMFCCIKLYSTIA